MNYLEQLKARKSQQSHNSETDKTAESQKRGAFVGFGGDYQSAYPKNTKAKFRHFLEPEKSKKRASPPPPKPTKVRERQASVRPAPSIAEFEERAAILEYDAGLSRKEAEEAAAAELGYRDAPAPFMASITAWQLAVASLTELPAESEAEALAAHRLEQLRDAALAFFDSGFALEAAIGARQEANDPDAHHRTVQTILDRILPKDATIWVFGSRATGQVRRASDLDLAIDAGRPLSRGELDTLTEAFELSDLPYKVDVVDYAAATPEFRVIIDRTKLPWCSVSRE